MLERYGAIVVFYEKPGCINNAKQKSMLRKAGHELMVKNLLTEPWTADALQQFFVGLPVSEWFNRSAPRVQSGEVVPEACSGQDALSLMLDDPLLIRRPLMQAGSKYMVGFDQEAVDAWLGLSEARSDEDVETCPRKHEA